VRVVPYATDGSPVPVGGSINNCEPEPPLPVRNGNGGKYVTPPLV